MQDELNVILESARSCIQSAKEVNEVEKLRVKYLGKKGQITELLKSVSSLPKEDRPKLGKAINLAKQELIRLLQSQEHELSKLAIEAKLQSEKIDVTLAGRKQKLGHLHPISQVRERVVALFNEMGFDVAEGPEVEDELHNFEALNIPAHHPARAAQDTFYFADGHLLRTHTSPVQIRIMEKQQPPFRIITPGRVYRRDSDQTHTPMFHQLEGLVVDKHCTFAELKGLLHEFFQKFFETEVQLRFRPSYFPFTEPSAEVDIKYQPAKGEGFGDWLEVLGCGMVHPNVLKNVNIDPDEFSGFAFGLGLDRLTMLRYGIMDLRMMFENDLRFLQQF